MPSIEPPPSSYNGKCRSSWEINVPANSIGRERRLVTTGIPQAERRADERIGCWNHNSRRRGSVYKFRDKSKVENDSPTFFPSPQMRIPAYPVLPETPQPR